MSSLSFLVSLAEMSHVASLASVLTGLLLMTLLTLRFMGQDWVDHHLGGGGAITRAPPHRPARVDLRPAPFGAWLKDVSSDDISVTVRLGSAPGITVVRAFWGVSVEAFHHILASPWAWFAHTILTSRSNVFGAGGCLCPGKTVFSPDGQNDIYIEMERPPELVHPSEYLGPAPRKTYPLVLVAMSAAKPVGEGTGGSHDEALVVAVHLQDPVCRISTHALATYVKNKAGQCTRLVPMYSQSDSECVVCQELKVTRCILPCRHACVCHQCFVLLQNRCPLCRTFISSYFPVGSDASSVGDTMAQPPPPTSTTEDARRPPNNSTNLVRRITRAFIWQ